MNKFVFLFCLVFLTGCGPVIQFNELTTLEYGTSAWQLIETIDAQYTVFHWQNQNHEPLQYTDLKIDTPYTLVVTSKKHGQTKSARKSIILKDTTAPEIISHTQLIQVEYGSDFDLQSWIFENVSFFDSYSSSENIRLEIPQLDHEKEHEKYQVRFTDEAENTSVLSLEVQITDTTPPKITVFQDKITMIEGNPFPDFTLGAQAFDIKDHVVPVIITPIPTNQTGTHSLNYKACDYNENCTEVPFTLIIKPKSTPKPTTVPSDTSNTIHPPQKIPSDPLATKEPVTCIVKEDVKNGYNGGIYDSWDECKAAGEGKPYDCGTVYDSCGNLVGIGLILR